MLAYVVINNDIVALLLYIKYRYDVIIYYFRIMRKNNIVKNRKIAVISSQSVY